VRCTEWSGDGIGLDPTADTVDEILYFGLGECVCSKIGDEGVVAKVLLESFVEIAFMGNVPFQESLEGLFAEAERLGLLSKEILSDLLEDGLDD
jgi:hypothetical protein